MDLSILQEDSDNTCRIILETSNVLKLRGKSKTTLPVLFPIDYYWDLTNVRRETEEPSLAEFQKGVISMFNSSNGRFLAGLLPNGDFKLYSVQTKTCKPVKGLPYFSVSSSRGIASKESLECFISNDGSLMLVKYYDK